MNTTTITITLDRVPIHRPTFGRPEHEPQQWAQFVHDCPEPMVAPVHVHRSCFPHGKAPQHITITITPEED